MSDQNTISRPDECPPEWTYSVYVDGELEPNELRVVDAHLIRCRTCRELVVALEDEATSLRAALLIEETTPESLHQVSPTRSLAMGASSSLAAALVAVTALGWILQVPIPTSLAWLNPFKLTGAFAMIFDTVSALRQNAPAIYQGVLSSGALLSVAFLLTSTFTFATRRWMGRETALLCMLAFGASFTFAFSAATPALAVDLRFDNDAETIPAGETIEDTWITSARTVMIEGTLRGDLIVFGDRVVISGVLDGNLLSGARKLEVPGRVTGSVIAFGERVQIGGEVLGNVYAATDQTTVSESGSLGRDFVGGGDGVLIAGTVGRDTMTFGSWIDVSGTIGNDLTAMAEHADIAASARIGGDVRVSYSDDATDVEIDPRASILGETVVEKTDHPHAQDTNRYTSAHFYLFFIVTLAAAFLAGMILFRVAPWIFATRIDTGSDLLRALAYGFLALVAVPIACVLIALTIIGIPVALIGFITFAICLYFAKIVVGGVIGTSILGQPEASDWRSFGLALIAGLGIVWVAGALPFIGGVVGFLTLLAGLGTIVHIMQRRFQA